MNPEDAEIKSIIDDLINKFVAILFPNTLYDSVRKNIKDSYTLGMEDVEKKLSMNFFQDSQKIGFLEKYTFDNIKGMNDEIADRLRKELSQGLFNLESVDQLKERVMKVMDVAEERARMIAITESTRAENQGRLDAAKQSDLKLRKEWSAANSDRTCNICNNLDGKIVPLTGKFKFQGVEYDAPPAHPRCRCALVFPQK